MSELLASPWVPTLALWCLAIAARQLRGSWLSPAAFVALIWAIYASGCVWLTDYEILPEGLWVIVLFVFCVQFGAILAQGISQGPLNIATPVLVDPLTRERWSGRSFTSSLFLTVVAIAGTTYLLFYSLQKYSLGFSLIDLLSLGNLWSVARYEKGEVEPWSVRLSIMWLYPAVLLAGICFATTRSRMRRYLSFAPFIPAILIGTVFAVRAGVLISAVCWFAGLLAVRFMESEGKYLVFRRKLLLTMLAMVISGFSFFVAIDSLRIFQGGDSVELRVDVPRIYKYFFGAIPAFCSWVHYSRPSDMGFGADTFSGVFDLLGIKHREIGVYQEMQTLADGEETNIYTLLRGLIQDFTLPGMCLFGVVLGTVAGNAARLHSRSPAVLVLVLAAYYALIVYSPIISIFVYNGLILAWVVAALVLGWRPQAPPSAVPVSMSV